MIKEIPQQDWKQFFDDISRKRLEGQTRVEVLKDDIGAQILSEGLSLIGLLFEEKANGEDQNAIEIMLGGQSGAHQTHTIFNPQKVFFESGEEGKDAIIEIEDESGGKTIIYFAGQISVLVAYDEVKIVART